MVNTSFGPNPIVAFVVIAGCMMTVMNLPARQKQQGYLQANALAVMKKVAALPVQRDGSKGTPGSMPSVQQMQQPPVSGRKCLPVADSDDAISAARAQQKPVRPQKSSGIFRVYCGFSLKSHWRFHRRTRKSHPRSALREV